MSFSDPAKLFPGWKSPTTHQAEVKMTPSAEGYHGEDSIYWIGYELDGTTAFYLKSRKHPRRKPVPIFKGSTEDLHRLGLQIAEAAMHLKRFAPPQKK